MLGQPCTSRASCGSGYIHDRNSVVSRRYLPASAWPEKNGTVTNTDRMVQMGRKAIEPPGDAKEDLWIIQKLASGLGLNWNYTGPDWC